VEESSKDFSGITNNSHSTSQDFLIWADRGKEWVKTLSRYGYNSYYPPLAKGISLLLPLKKGGEEGFYKTISLLL
jgi:hypothetical protein